MTDGKTQQGLNGRIEPRDEVYGRARATLADRRTVSLTVVNVSPHGLMARCDTVIEVGAWLKVDLPAVGTVNAGVRWSLGGRIGCQLDRAIEAKPYRALLAAFGG